MATTLTSSTQLLTVTKTYTQNGETKNIGLSHSMSACLFDDMRTMRVPFAAEISILDIAAAGTAIGPGKLDSTKVLYLILKNCDDTNYITLGFKKTGAETFYLKVSTGMLIVMPTMQYDVDAAGGAFGAFVYPTTIVAQANTADVDIMYNIFQST